MKIKTVQLLFLLITLNPAQLLSEENTISVKEEKLKIKSFNYYVNEVIDARDNKLNLGNFHHSLMEARSEANFKNDLTEELFSLFCKNFPADNQKHPIAIKVNLLHLYDNYLSDFGLVGVVEINLDFYTVSNGLYYHEFRAANYREFESNCTNYLFEKYTAWAIQDCLTEFQDRMEKGLGYHKLMDKPALYKISNDKNTEERLTKLNRRRGIYYSFNDFRDDITDTITGFNLMVNPDYTEDLFIVSFNKKGLRPKDVWGVCDQGSIYVRYQNDFIPVNPTDTGLILQSMPYHIMIYPSNNAILLSQVYFGIAGSVAAGMVAATSKSNKAFEKFNCKLDMATGQIISIEKPANMINQPGLLVFAQKFKYKKHKIDLYVNGNFQCNLRPNCFTIILPDLNGKNTQLCLKSEKNEHCEAIDTTKEDTRFYEASISKDGSVELIAIKGSSSKKTIVHQIKEKTLIPICIDK